jgi:hypothetical protein
VGIISVFGIEDRSCHPFIRVNRCVCEKMVQLYPNPFVDKINTYIFTNEQSKINNHPMGKNSPNLVILRPNLTLPLGANFDSRGGFFPQG